MLSRAGKEAQELPVAAKVQAELADTCHAGAATTDQIGKTLRTRVSQDMRRPQAGGMHSVSGSKAVG